MRRSDRAPHDRLRSKRGGKGRPSPGGGHRPAVAPARTRTAEPVEDERPGAIRLQKLLSLAGVASRRTAEILIAEGRVTVNGEVVSTLGTKAVPDTDDIKVDGRRIRPAGRARYILLNKPRGYVTTRRDPEGRRTVLDLLAGVREYVYPVGRLDYDTEGLLLLTSDGDLAARLTHPRHEVPRVYEAIVAGAPDDDAVEELRRGVFLDGRRTAEAEVTPRPDHRQGARADDQAGAHAVRRPQPAGARDVRAHRPPGAHAAAGRRWARLSLRGLPVRRVAGPHARPRVAALTRLLILGAGRRPCGLLVALLRAAACPRSPAARSGSPAARSRAPATMSSIFGRSVEVLQPEADQELLGRAVEERPADDVLAADDLDQVPLEQRRQHAARC